MVSQNEITWVFEILDIFRAVSPFLRVQINTEEFGLLRGPLLSKQKPSLLSCTLENGLAV